MLYIERFNTFKLFVYGDEDVRATARQKLLDLSWLRETRSDAFGEYDIYKFATGRSCSEAVKILTPFTKL